jgi:hypothetical protein
MNQLLLKYQSPIIVKIVFQDIPKYPYKVTLYDFSYLINNLRLLYEYTSIISIPYYKKLFYQSNATPDFLDVSTTILRPENQLYLNKIHYESPLGLEVIIPVSAALIGMPWVLIQAFDKISNWKLNRTKLKLEITNLYLDAEKKMLEMESKSDKSSESLIAMSGFLNKSKIKVTPDMFIEEQDLKRLFLHEPNLERTFQRIINKIEQSDFKSADIRVMTVKVITKNKKTPNNTT